MGSLILCHNQKAKQPYEITRIHKKIYTLEELCFYISNRLYLVDYTIVNKQLCVWLSDELGLVELAKTLRNILKQNGSMEQFVLTILRDSHIYEENELQKIQDVLLHLKNQKELERIKYKADDLMKSGETAAAVYIYLHIIHTEKDDTLPDSFYGKVYGCLGAAYGKMFLYQEAAKMYEKAYEICKDETMQRAYVYCCKQSMGEAAYREWLFQNKEWSETDRLLQRKLENVEECADASWQGEEQLHQWKEAYRNIH